MLPRCPLCGQLYSLFDTRYAALVYPESIRPPEHVGICPTCAVVIVMRMDAHEREKFSEKKRNAP